MNARFIKYSLTVIEDMLFRLERAAYLHQPLHGTGTHMTQARGQIQQAIQALPVRRPPAASPGRGR